MLRMPTTRSANAHTSTDGLCTTATTMQCLRCARSRSAVMTESTVPGSSPEVGSSQSSSLGFLMSSIAMLTRFCWPPLILRTSFALISARFLGAIVILEPSTD
mmetsp:Transcript_552/g.1788  ORF Transcript_552/g.1788 Transcript_552/m.1788 type:complete len:103 (-) Transcript_552:1090-1398(-)